MAGIVVPLIPENTITVSSPTLIEGRAYDVGDFRDLELMILVRGVSGSSPNLGLKLQHSMDMVDWLDKTSFVAITSPTGSSNHIDQFLRYVRMVSTVNGAPGTFTYYVYAVAKD